MGGELFDQRLGSLAQTQHGVFTLAQVRALGGSRAVMRSRASSGRWLVAGPRTYVFPGTAIGWRQELMIGILANGPGAVASHRSAAALWAIPGFAEGGVELSRPRRATGRPPVGPVDRLHHPCELPGADVVVRHTIPLTRPARTLCDLAGVLPEAQVERALDNALAMRLVTLPTVEAVAKRLAAPGRPGWAVLQRLLAERLSGYVAPASELEARFIALLRAAALPSPVRQLAAGSRHSMAGRVDFAYPEEGLVIEVDGQRHHGQLLAFEEDRRRDAELTAGGWRVMRFTWRQVTREASWVARTVADALAVGSRAAG